MSVLADGVPWMRVLDGKSTISADFSISSTYGDHLYVLFLLVIHFFNFFKHCIVINTKHLN